MFLRGTIDNAKCTRIGICGRDGARHSRAQAPIAQFYPHHPRQQGNHPFRHSGCKQSAIRIGRRQGAIAPSGHVAESQGLDRGALYDHAGSYPFFLCANRLSAIRFPCLDGVLEAYGVESFSVSARLAALAEGLLGHAATLRRELCRQVGVCACQSRAKGVGG